MSVFQWEEFKLKGDDWTPSEKYSVPLIGLFPGDTLVMCPENHNVHAPVTIEDCGMSGGMFWDSWCMKFTLEKILDQIKAPGINNEDPSKELIGILTTLKDQTSDSEIKTLCATILSTSCSCRSSCKKCPCRVGSRKCSFLCFSHVNCIND